MPYSGPGDESLPSNVKKLSAKKRRQWVNVFNGAYKSCRSKGGTDSACETSAFKQANGVVKTNALILTTHQMQAQPTRRETIAGVEYLIAPAVAIRPGVLNGRLVEANVIEASAPYWNGVPAPLGVHPSEDGVHVSANTPELTASNPARFWHPYIEDGALKGEIWIDLARAEALGGDAWEAVQRLERGELLENSTGYFADERMGSGVYGGQRYSSVVTAIYPDHLAILLHEVGACSVEDGCGVLANNEGDMITHGAKLRGLLNGLIDKKVSNDTSRADIVAEMGRAAGIAPGTVNQILSGSINCPPENRLAGFAKALGMSKSRLMNAAKEDGCNMATNQITVNLEFSLTDQENRVYEAWYTLKYPNEGMAVPTERALEGRIIRVLADRVDVVRLDGIFAYDYQMDEEGNVEFGEPRQYTLSATEPTTNAGAERGFVSSFMASLIKTLSPSKEVRMKEKLIKQLLANQRCKFSEEQLKALDEGALQALSETVEEPAPANGEQPAAPPAPASPPADDLPTLVKSLAETVKAQGEQIAQLTGTLTANAAAARQPVIEWITTNSDGLYTADDLKDKPQADLDKIRALVERSKPWRPAVNYAGQGMPAANGGKADVAKPRSLRAQKSGGEA